MYQKIKGILAERLSGKITKVLSAKSNEDFTGTVMDLFVNASKLFKFETVTVFLKAIERHLVPFLIICDHLEIHQVSLCFVDFAFDTLKLVALCKTSEINVHVHLSHW